jgi:uncharacterized membrane protein YgcG
MGEYVLRKWREWFASALQPPLGAGNSQDELTIGLDQSLEDAVDVFVSSGVCLLPEAIPGDVVRTLLEKARANLAYLKQYSAEQREGYELEIREGGRLDMRYQMESAPFYSLSIVKNASWFPLVTSLLGSEVCLLYMGVLVAERLKNKSQEWHRDGDHLYKWAHQQPYCIQVFVPLTDLHSTNGPTEFQPGSQLLDSECARVSLPLRASAGSAVVYDVRVQHRGSGNSSPDDRLMLYLTYCSPWFSDHHSNARAQEHLIPGSNEWQPILLRVGSSGNSGSGGGGAGAGAGERSGGGGGAEHNQRYMNDAGAKQKRKQKRKRGRSSDEKRPV